MPQVTQVTIESENDSYEVEMQVAKFPYSRVCLVHRLSDGVRLLLQAATTFDDNSRLARAAYIYSYLATRAEEIEKEYATKGKGGKLNYHLHFPALEEAFTHATKKGNQQMIVTGFHHVTDPNQMVPVRHVIEADKLRTDLRSTVWIVGKALKALQFAHDAFISIGMTDAGNLLIEPNQHYVVFFDLASAELRTEPVPHAVRTEEIIEVAKAAIDLAEGDAETGEFPDTEDGRLKPYVDSLIELANGSYCDANEAHRHHYEVADSLWEPGAFHRFTCFPRNTKTERK
jgi:hypothetical protein